MINIVICDDEKVILQQLYNYVLGVFAEQNVECSIQSYSQPLELLQAIRNQKCDILLLDIEMPGINGMDIAAKLREMGHQPLLILLQVRRHWCMNPFSINPLILYVKLAMRKNYGLRCYGQ